MELTNSHHEAIRREIRRLASYLPSSQRGSLNYTLMQTPTASAEAVVVEPFFLLSPNLKNDEYDKVMRGLGLATSSMLQQGAIPSLSIKATSDGISDPGMGDIFQSPSANRAMDEALAGYSSSQDPDSALYVVLVLSILNAVGEADLECVSNMARKRSSDAKALRDVSKYITGWVQNHQGRFELITLSSAITKWRKGKIQQKFLTHDPLSGDPGEAASDWLASALTPRDDAPFDATIRVDEIDARILDGDSTRLPSPDDIASLGASISSYAETINEDDVWPNTIFGGSSQADDYRGFASAFPSALWNQWLYRVYLAVRASADVAANTVVFGGSASTTIAMYGSMLKEMGAKISAIAAGAVPSAFTDQGAILMGTLSQSNAALNAIYAYLYNVAVDSEGVGFSSTDSAEDWASTFKRLSAQSYFKTINAASPHWAVSAGNYSLIARWSPSISDMAMATKLIFDPRSYDLGAKLITGRSSSTALAAPRAILGTSVPGHSVGQSPMTNTGINVQTGRPGEALTVWIGPETVKLAPSTANASPYTLKTYAEIADKMSDTFDFQTVPFTGDPDDPGLGGFGSWLKKAWNVVKAPVVDIAKAALPGPLGAAINIAEGLFSKSKDTAPSPEVTPDTAIQQAASSTPSWGGILSKGLGLLGLGKDKGPLTTPIISDPRLSRPVYTPGGLSSSTSNAFNTLLPSPRATVAAGACDLRTLSDMITGLLNNANGWFTSSDVSAFANAVLAVSQEVSRVNKGMGDPGIGDGRTSGVVNSLVEKLGQSSSAPITADPTSQRFENLRDLLTAAGDADTFLENL